MDYELTDADGYATREDELDAIARAEQDLDFDLDCD